MNIQTLSPTKPEENFESVSRRVLAFLHTRLGFNLWMLTRTEGDDWVVLQAEDHGYQVRPGQVFRWADSICARMVERQGPTIAPAVASVAAYASAPIASKLRIGAYIGVPIVHEDGTLFGTLCAIDPEAQPDSVAQEKDLIELFGSMLSKILQAELKSEQEARRAEKLEAESMADPLTGTYNRRGWDRLLASEEERCRRFGHKTAVVIVDLDELKAVNDTQGHFAGDQLLTRTASALQSVARSVDIVARLGGDEFGMIAIELDLVGVTGLLRRVESALGSADIKASIGLAVREPGLGLSEAWSRADQAMYENKRTRVG